MMIHDSHTQSAQITESRWETVHHVPKCMSCHKAIKLFFINYGRECEFFLISRKIKYYHHFCAKEYSHIHSVWLLLIYSFVVSDLRSQTQVFPLNPNTRYVQI